MRASEGSDLPLFVMHADGSQQKRATRLIAFGFDRSANGQRIVYEGGANAVSGIDGLYVAERGTVRERQLRVRDCYGPVISDDGTRVACEYSEPHWIKVMDVTRGRARLITPDCCYRPSWSPDGKRIAYVSFGRWNDDAVTGRSGVFVMNADGTDKRLVAARGYDDHQSPQWSPDGRRLAFISGDDIWLVGVDRTFTRKLLDGGGRNTKDVAWSPDGRKLAFTHGDGDYEVFVVNADGTGAKKLTDNERVPDEQPSWSPDGTAIAFSSMRDGNFEIYTMRADGSGQTRLTQNATDDTHPSWSP